MKNLTLILLLAIMSWSCRAVLRSKSSADSTAVRSQNSNEKFTREIIREYLPGTHDTIYQHSVSTIEVPKVVTIDRPVLVRETVRETGERQQSQSEEKAVLVQEKQVEKEPMPWWVFVALGVGAVIALLVIAAVIYVVIKIRNLPASIIAKV